MPSHVYQNQVLGNGGVTDIDTVSFLMSESLQGHQMDNLVYQALRGIRPTVLASSKIGLVPFNGSH